MRGLFIIKKKRGVLSLRVIAGVVYFGMGDSLMIVAGGVS